MDYQKIYDNLIIYRKTVPLEKSKEHYTESHHITPRCLGGSDEPGNLVRLTAREHFIAHRLLAKIYPEVSALIIPLHLMKRGSVCTKQIEFAKEVSSREQSKRMKQLWGNESFRNKMIERRNSEEFLLQKSKVSSIKWKDEVYRHKTIEGMKEGQRKFLQANPWPWQRSNGLRVKHLWTLCATFWEVSKYNPNSTERRSAYLFVKEFLGGKNCKTFETMENLFKEGWNPLECKDYLKEFGSKM